MKSTGGLVLALGGVLAISSCEPEADETPRGIFLKFPLDQSPLGMGATTHPEQGFTMIAGYVNADVLRQLRKQHTKITINASYGTASGERSYFLDDMPNGRFEITARGAPPSLQPDIPHEVYAVTAKGDRVLV